MKNFEKYIENIIDLIMETDCYGCNCGDCCFNRLSKDWCVITKHDKQAIKQFLLEECKEPCPLSHDEYVILKNLGSEWKFQTNRNLWQ